MRERPSAKDPFLVRFAREWGWRAYAIPVLLVLTIIVVVDVVRDAGEETGCRRRRAAQGPRARGRVRREPRRRQLPPGGPFTEESSGIYVPVDLVAAGARATTTVMRYAVESRTPSTRRFGGADASAR